LIRNCGVFFFVPGCASDPDPAFRAGLYPAFSPGLDSNQSFGSVFTESESVFRDFAESGSSLLLIMDPMRTRTQNKIYF
jgi:hypothetical protein